MPRAPLSEDELMAFRNQAIAVAERLFAERGAEGVTMRALSEGLGCSPMTPYRYFENQEHLLAEVRAQAFERLAQQQEMAARAGGDPLSRIRRLRESYLAFALAEPHVYRAMFSLPPPNVPRPSLDRAAEASFAQLRLAVAAAVEEGALPGNPAVLAHLIWAELHGLVSLSQSNKLNLGTSLRELAGSSLLDLATAPPKATTQRKPAAKHQKAPAPEPAPSPSKAPKRASRR